MSKTKKLAVLLISILTALALVCFAACGEGSTKTSESENETDTTVESPSDQDSSSDEESDRESESQSDEQLDAEYIEAIPETALTVTATADDKTATAYFYFAYGENALDVSAIVVDGTIVSDAGIYNNDSVEIIFDTVKRVKGYSENTLSVIIDVNGEMNVRKLADNTSVNAAITKTANMITLDNESVSGYAVSFELPYDLVGISAEEKNAAVCVGLTNAVDDITVAGAYFDGLKTDAENVHTYVMVLGDNEYKANQYLQYSYVWGEAADLTMGTGWNTEHDDGGENPYITLDRLDNDNYIYMFNSNAKKIYAEAKFNIKELLNGERWGKFGMTVTSADGKDGFFFYVDASSADGVNFNESSVRLGYNTRANVGNGGWAGNWSDIGTLGGTSAQYTGDNSVTLGIYRQGALFALYANGEFVKYVTCAIREDTEAYIGACGFNMLMKVSGYSLATENLEKYEIVSEEKDYLFIGDSYMDTAFWYTYGSTFGNEAANEGVGGTKTEYWLNQLAAMQALYSPENIIVHIGVNDIDDGNTSGEECILRLNRLIAAYEEAFPNANIYYVGLVHNMMFKNKWAEYDKVNAHMAEMAENDAKLNYIDMAKYIVADEENSTMRWFNGDGLHYSVDGYAVLTREILGALGIERTVSANGLGDVTVEGAPALTYSAGWKVDENGVWENKGVAESQLFISDLYTAEDFYAEAKISVAGLNAYDAYPKAGLAIRTTEATYFWGLDCALHINDNGNHFTNNWSMVFRRPEVINRDWDWDGCWTNGYKYVNPVSFDYKVDHSFKTLAIARKGNTFYFIADDLIVGTLENIIPSDMEVAVSVFNFNMDMYAKDASAIVGADNVAYRMYAPHKITAGEYEGVTIEVSKNTAKKTDEITFTVDAGEKILDKVYVNGAEVTADEKGVYKFEMPDEDAAITITFKGLMSIDMSAVDGKATASATTVVEGNTVTFAATDKAVINKLYANDVEIVPVDGVYSIVVNENLTITGEFWNKYGNLVLDGTLDSYYGTGNTVAEYDDDRTITVYGVKTNDGLFLHVTAIMNTQKTDSNEWFLNTNFEFKLNRGEQRHINIVGDTQGVSDHFWKTTLLANNKYQHVVEAYFDKSIVNGWTDDGYVVLNYAWKTEGEVASVRGDIVTAWAITWNGDWLARHAGGLDIGGGDFSTGINTNGALPTIIRIDENGLRKGEDAKEAVIDGNLEEYASLKSVTRSDDRKSVTVTGKAGGDGLYLAFTITHNGWSPLHTDDWSKNDNLEIRIDNVGSPLMFGNGKLMLSEFWHRGKAVTTVNEGVYTTTVELFAPSNGVTKSYALQLGMNGDASGFNGWLGAIWDWNFAFITPEGVIEQNPALTDGMHAEYVLDGEFNDAIWTDAVKAKTYTTDANGATVSVMGVNGSYGVMLGFTVVHKQALDHVIQQNGTGWWHFQNVEFRLIEGVTQRAVSHFDNFHASCEMGYKSVDNGDGTYTTTYEVLVPYYTLAGHDASYRYEFWMGGVYETGFKWLFTDNRVSHYITVNGMEQA